MPYRAWQSIKRTLPMNFSINLGLKKMRHIYNVAVFILTCFLNFVILCNYMGIICSILVTPIITFFIIYLFDYFIISYIRTDRNKWVLSCVTYSSFPIFYYISKHFFWETITICCLGIFFIIAITIAHFYLKKTLSILRSKW